MKESFAHQMGKVAAIDDEEQQQSWLGRNWPWLAGGGLAAGATGYGGYRLGRHSGLKPAKRVGGALRSWMTDFGEDPTGMIGGEQNREGYHRAVEHLGDYLEAAAEGGAQ